MNPMAVDAEVLTLEEVSELLRIHPSTLYKDDQAGQDSELPNRHRLAIPKAPASALDGRTVHWRPSMRKSHRPAGKLVWTGTT
jgi:hypothetical protein